MVKLNLELDMRKRERHFGTSTENQRKNMNRIQGLFKMFNRYFNCYGLRISETQLINSEANNNNHAVNISIQENPPDLHNIRYTCQFLREKLNMSEDDYKLFHCMLSAHLVAVPTLNASNEIKKQMNELFPISSNGMGWYLTDPIRKIRFALINFLAANNQFAERKFAIKIAGDLKNY
jgi:hypothetical protein